MQHANGVSITHRPPLHPRKYSWYYFLLEAARRQDHTAVRRTMSMKSSNYTIGNRTRVLPLCGAVPLPTAAPRTLDSYLSINTLIILHTLHLQPG